MLVVIVNFSNWHILIYELPIEHNNTEMTAEFKNIISRIN